VEGPHADNKDMRTHRLGIGAPARMIRVIVGPEPGQASGLPWLALVVLLLLVAFWHTAWVDGGTGRVPPTGFLLPVTLAAARFRYVGGVVVGLAAGVLAGPLLPRDTLTGAMQSSGEWGLRAGLFLLAGLTVAWLLDRYRDVQVRLRASDQVVQALTGRAPAGPSSRREYRIRRRRIESVLAGRDMTMVFQPVVELRTERRAGFEALARFDRQPGRPPNEWFAEAWEIGLGVELELHAVRVVMREMDGLPGEGYVSINLSAGTVASPEFREMLPGLPVGRLVIEMTEHTPVADYPALREVLGELRSRGGRVAVDDAGAGYASFRHVLQLSPELIKLDMSLVRNVDRDPALRSLASGVAMLAAQIGADMVAEGIETEGELRTLRTLGVRFGQGWYRLGRPRSVTDHVARAAADVESGTPARS